MIKEGDLVKRKYDEVYNADELEEIGLIVKWEGITEQIVLWPSIGLSWEDEHDLELVNESR